MSRKLSDKFIDRLLSEDECKHVHDSYFLANIEIKKALAPFLWFELVAEIKRGHKKLGDALNEKFVIDDSGHRELKLMSLEKPNTVTLKYNREVPCVFYGSRNGEGYLSFRVLEDGNSILFVSQKQPFQIEEIASAIVSEVLGLTRGINL